MAKVHYALKANPGKPVIELLRDLGSNFDIASIYELDKVLLKLKDKDKIKKCFRIAIKIIHKIPIF